MAGGGAERRGGGGERGRTDGGRGRESELWTEAEVHWERVVELIQTAFWDGYLAEEATWQALVLIPKGKGDYRGIGLVEVMWKVEAVVLNSRLTSSITSTTSSIGSGQVAARGPPPSRPSCYNSLYP